ncbi:MAG: hypothetical protein IKI40_06095 [Treponema sp.]|nr:hypothetical protein [Treponema sp.]
MKKRGLFVLVLAMSFCFAGNAWADGWYSGLEVGGGASFEIAVGDMHEHEVGSLGLNVDAAWPLPLGFPKDGFLSAVGLTAQTGVVIPVGKKGYIDSWWGIDLDIGAYVDLRINQLITVRPELAADMRLNIVSSESRSADGAYVDFGAKAGATVLFDVFKNGVLLKTGAGYSFFPEKDHVCHYIHINAGATYKFN